MGRSRSETFFSDLTNRSRQVTTAGCSWWLVSNHKRQVRPGRLVLDPGHQVFDHLAEQRLFGNEHGAGSRFETLDQFGEVGADVGR